MISSNFALHGRIHSFAQTSSTETARDTTDHMDKVEGVASRIAPEVQTGKAVKAQFWLQRVIPKSLWPYAQLARIDKPIGIWLFAWPCLWATSFAAPLGSFPDLKFTALFGLWAFLMRCAACTVNDIFDKDFDGKVERTKSRPLPSGAATVVQATWFVGLQLLAAALVSSPLNGLSQLLGAVYVLLFCIYPLLKRVTSWPQAFLGVLLRSGFFVGWAAIRDSIDLSIVLPMFASGALWTVVYDTIYAHQDKEYDAKIGVKSTALLFGDNTRAILTACSVGSVALLALGGLKGGLGWPFYAGVALAAGHLTWQVGTVDLDQPEDCGSKFRSNQWYGAIVWSTIILGNLVAAPA